MKVFALLLAGMCFFSFANVKAAEQTTVVPAKADTEKEKPSPNTITIDNFTFSPKTLTVAPGTTVTWINRDDVPHTVKSTEDKFKSGTLDTDEKFTFTFKDKGTFKYFCTVHAHMTGEIIVKK